MQTECAREALDSTVYGLIRDRHHIAAIAADGDGWIIISYPQSELETR